MNDLETIIRQNRKAVELDIIKAGTAVGTDRFIHDYKAIAPHYPFSVVGRGPNGWQVQNLLTGQEYEIHLGIGACAAAHEQAAQLQLQTTATN